MVSRCYKPISWQLNHFVYVSSQAKHPLRLFHAIGGRVVMAAKLSSVRIVGSANIRDIRARHDQLSIALRQSEIINLDLAACIEPDLSFVQLVYAARRHAEASGKTLSLTSPVDNALRDVLHRGGFLHGAEDRAFWLHELVAK